MIKKIDANKYGVVRYAISSIEDIADLPREVSVGSEAILVNEDGEKKFRLGSDGWVEVVEVKEYDEDKLRDILEDAKVGYRGIEYETLEERLDKDFDNVYSVLDNRTYVEYEGRRITAKDSLNGLQKDTVIKGRTLQNVIHKDTFKDSTVYHKLSTEQCSLDGEYIKMNANGTFVNAWTRKTNLIKPNTVYTMILEIKENTLITNQANPFVLVGNHQDECFKGVKYIDASDKGVKVFTLETKESLNGTTILLRSYINTPATEGYITFRYMILEGDHTETPLEELPFIEGIESVGDKSKNLFNGQIEEGQFTTTGQPQQSSIYIRSVNFIKVKSNTNYVMSYKNSDVRLGIYEYDINKNFIKVIYDGNPKYFTTLGTTQYLKFRVEKSTTDIQLEEGTHATPYQPYYDGYKISGKIIGKNIFEAKNKSTFNDKGVTIEYIGGNSYRINGTATEQVIHAINTVDGSIKNNLYFKAGKKYIVSDGGNSSYTTFMTQLAVINTVTNEALFPTTANGAITIFNNQDCIGRVVLVLRSGVEFDNVIMNIQIEESTTPTPYEPYKESTYSYILDEPLCSLPNGVCDEIDLEKGIVTRRVGKVVIDGTATVTNIDRPIDESLVRVNISCETNKVGGMLICDSLPYFNIHNLPNGSNTIDFECICSHSVSNDFDLVLKVQKVGGYTLAAFFNYIKNNPITVYYELAEPTTEYLIKDDKFVTLPNGVKDEISHNSVLRKVEKIVLDGSKVFETDTGVEGIVRWGYYVSGAKIGGSCICSMFDYITPVQTWWKPFKDGITVNSENSDILIYMDRYKEKGQHVEEVRTLLDGLEVYYELKAPYTESINLNEVILDTIRLKSYEPITHIISDNYLPPTIKTQVPSDFNAVVLGLKSNNEALASQVMSLRQTNDELEVTNREQDDVIDVTLLALDEVYGMIDEGEIEAMSMGSPMVNVYVKMIKRGIKTLDEVPAKYRAEVEELI